MRSVFTTLPTTLLLLSILSLPSLGSLSVWAKLDPKDPEYARCMNNECAPYLNITSYCNNLKTDGNFTWDEKIAEQNFLRCACPSAQYLPGLQTCDECIGNSTYSEKKAECDARDGATHTTAISKHSATPTAGASNTSTAGSPTQTTKTTTTDNSSGARVVSILGLWMGDAGYMLSGSLFGIAAVLAGVL